MTRLTFQERMAGRVTFGGEDLRAGARGGEPLSFEVRIDIDDVHAFLDEGGRTARLSGVVRCPALGGDLEVLDGSTWTLFAGTAPDRPRSKRMLYRVLVRGEAGDATVSGFKDLTDDPDFDVWKDFSRLLTTVYAGHARTPDEERAATPIARGVLTVSHLEFTKLMTGMRASGSTRWGNARALARFQMAFAGELARLYLPLRTPKRAGPEAWPDPLRPGDERWHGHPPEVWHAVPRKPGLERQVVGFAAGDGVPLTLHHLRAAGAPAPTRGPVLLAAGTGVRANVLYGAPGAPSVCEALLDAGYDVWVENWRASIDLPPVPYVLDDAARFDHPAAVAEVLRRTGAGELKAVVHCAGAASFTWAATSGLLPQVTDVVATSIGLHVELLRASRRKLMWLTPGAALTFRRVDPQWALDPPAMVQRAYVTTARALRRECSSPVCATTQFAYGTGPDVLWRHASLDDDVHAWLDRESGWVPVSFFRQMRRSARRGSLVAARGLDGLEPDPAAAEPRTDARFTFLTGSENRCFLPSGIERTADWFDRHQPGRHSYEVIDGFGHLDAWFGRDAPERVHRRVVGALG